MTSYSNHLLYGKNQTERIVAIEVHDDQAEIIRELEDGTIETTFVPNKFWMLSDRSHGKGWIKLGIFEECDPAPPYKWNTPTCYRMIK